MWSLPDAPDVMIALGTLLAGCAAFWGAFSAHQGLDAWKKEKDSELAKRLADVTYQHRKSIHHIRFPVVSEKEQELLQKEHEGEFSSAMLLRWQNSRKKLEEVEALLAEGDLRWKNAATEAYKPVLDVDTKIIREISLLGITEKRLKYEELNRVSNHEKYDNLFAQAIRLKGQLEDSFSDTDELRSEITIAFSEITNLLKEKL